jgi:hypothetical protein
VRAAYINRKHHGLALQRLLDRYAFIYIDQNSSVNQLADVARDVREKLDFEDFGGMLRKQGSRIPVKFCYATNTAAADAAAAAAAAPIPDDVDMAPTEETIVDFLISLHKALQDENKILRYIGTTSAAVLVALTQALCPDDLRVEVQGRLIQQGTRDSVIFSIDHVANQPRFVDEVVQCPACMFPHGLDGGGDVGLVFDVEVEEGDVFCLREVGHFGEGARYGKDVETACGKYCCKAKPAPLALQLVIMTVLWGCRVIAMQYNAIQEWERVRGCRDKERY